MLSWQCQERTFNLWNLSQFIYDFWNWARYFCFWTRTEVSFDPILSYFQESSSDWIFEVHCMWYTWRFYARFSTSSAKSCFLDFRYARISVSVCCRSQLILSGMGWDAMCISGMHMDCTTFGFHSELSSKGGVKIYISGRWEISCTCMTSYLVVLMVDNIVNERITLRSWDFTEYHLRMIWFFGMKSLRLDVSYCIVEIWAIIICERQIHYVFSCWTSIKMVNEHNRHCGCTRYAL